MLKTNVPTIKNMANKNLALGKLQITYNFYLQIEAL